MLCISSTRFQWLVVIFDCESRSFSIFFFLTSNLNFIARVKLNSIVIFQYSQCFLFFYCCLSNIFVEFFGTSSKFWSIIVFVRNHMYIFFFYVFWHFRQRLSVRSSSKQVPNEWQNVLFNIDANIGILFCLESEISVK